MKLIIGEQAPIECAIVVIGFLDGTCQAYCNKDNDIICVNPSAIKSLSVKLRDNEKTE